MAFKMQTPANGAAGSVREPEALYTNRGYGSAAVSRTDLNAPTTGVADFGHGDSAGAVHQDNYDTMQHNGTGLDRSASVASNPAGRDGAVSRSNTLKKKNSLSRKTSLKRSSSRKSLKAGSIKGAPTTDGTQDHHYNSAFYTPIPTTGAPTEILANRFQGMFRLSNIRV